MGHHVGIIALLSFYVLTRYHRRILLSSSFVSGHNKTDSFFIFLSITIPFLACNFHFLCISSLPFSSLSFTNFPLSFHSFPSFLSSLSSHCLYSARFVFSYLLTISFPLNYLFYATLSLSHLSITLRSFLFLSFSLCPSSCPQPLATIPGGDRDRSTHRSPNLN